MEQTPLALTDDMTRGLAQLGVVLCYAHGSVINGTAMRESDLDIAILFNAMPENALRTTTQIANALGDLAPRRELDIAILNEASPLFKQVVAVEGLLLYARSEDDRIRFEVHAMHEYEDSKGIRAIGYAALKARYAAL